MNSCTKRDQILSRSFQNYAIITIIESIHYIGIDVVFNKLSFLNDFFQIFEFIFNYSSHFFFYYLKEKFIIMLYVYIFEFYKLQHEENYILQRET